MDACQFPLGPLALTNFYEWTSYKVANYITQNQENTTLFQSDSRPLLIKLRKYERSYTELQVLQGWEWFSRFFIWGIHRKNWNGPDCGSIFCDFIGTDSLSCKKCLK